jgi:hypothetical protein
VQSTSVYYMFRDLARFVTLALCGYLCCVHLCSVMLRSVTCMLCSEIIRYVPKNAYKILIWTAVAQNQMSKDSESRDPYDVRFCAPLSRSDSEMVFLYSVGLNIL